MKKHEKKIKLTKQSLKNLATGRGKMSLSEDTALDSVAAADALLIEDPIELRLILAFRDAPTRSRAPLVEVIEQLASLRTGRRAGGTRA